MTQRDLAQLANVSVSTVSKAFSDSTDISEETRNHIFQVARDNHCYEMFHKGLYFKKVIAVICPEIQSEYYHRMCVCLNEEIENQGMTMILSLSEFNPDKIQSLIAYHAYYQKVDGIIIIKGDFSDLKCDPKIPVVIIGNTSSPKFDTVQCDYLISINEAISYLVKMGHRKIGFIGDELTYKKLERYKSAIKKHQLPLYKEHIATSSRRFEEGGYDCMEELLSHSNRPTAVICGYDYMAFGAIRCLREHSMSVPDDMSIIGMDDVRQTQFPEVNLTTISDQYEKICNTTLKLLLKRINGRGFSEHQHIVIPTKLHIRNSVKDLNKEK